MPTLQLRQLRHREAKSLPLNHTATKWQSQDLYPLHPEPVLLTIQGMWGWAEWGDLIPGT